MIFKIILRNHINSRLGLLKTKEFNLSLSLTTHYAASNLVYLPTALTIKSNHFKQKTSTYLKGNTLKILKNNFDEVLQGDLARDRTKLIFPLKKCFNHKKLITLGILCETFL